MDQTGLVERASQGDHEAFALRRQGVPRAVLVFAVLALLLVLLVATVAFVGTRPSLPALGAATNGLIAFASGGDIVVVEPDGNGRRTLISGAGEPAGIGWSPDGRRLAYWTTAPAAETFDLVVVDSDGSDPVTIATGVLELTMPRLAWSPDGNTIAYSAKTDVVTGPSCQSYGDSAFCTSRIFLAAVDGSGVRQIGDPDLDSRSPDWSPDGSTIAFGGGSANPTVGVHLYLMNADGSNVRQLSDVRGSDWAFVKVDWSHDGTKIAGQAGATDDINEWDIWVINADGSGATNVGAPGDDEIIPSWAPDRAALAWVGKSVVLMDEGTDPVYLPGPDGTPTWSPDGKLLAAQTDDGVVVMDLAGTVLSTIERAADGMAWQPRFD